MAPLLVMRPTRGRRMSGGDFRHSPLLVFYEVTQACDLVCQHCRACAQTESDPAELSTAEARRLIDQLKQFPTPPMLVLTGGDPLKRADIFALVEYAAWSGLDVSITPSATPLVTQPAIRRLRDAGISRLAISLDGADAATHDGVRGVAGSFARSLRILADARAAGVPTQVNTTLTPANADQIEAMAGLLASQEIDMWSVFFLVPVGRARWLPRLSATECEAAFARLWREAQRQPYAIKTTEAPHYRRYVIQHQLSKAARVGRDVPPPAYVPQGVNDGKGVMFVSHCGLVHPSGFLPIVCGVFPLEHLVQIYQESPIFRALRDADRLEGKCRVCEFRHLCGGSRARAYAVTGNLFAQEPDCAYVPTAPSAEMKPVMTRTSRTAAQPSIREEHLHLRHVMLELRGVLAKHAAPRREVARLLEELAQQVLEHFNHEESSGYFEAAIDAAPWLSERAATLLAEHAQMTQQLVALQRRAATEISGTPWWHALQSDLAGFMDCFSAHEEAENRLLQEAYLDDIGTED